MGTFGGHGVRAFWAEGTEVGDPGFLGRPESYSVVHHGGCGSRAGPDPQPSHTAQSPGDTRCPGPGSGVMDRADPGPSFQDILKEDSDTEKIIHRIRKVSPSTPTKGATGAQTEAYVEIQISPSRGKGSDLERGRICKQR